ncbi:11270_t:CDS:2 [Entrophospora sp. SA101]|nr:11270_t:CDS:2 [Entrophospora sp. SA101]
MFNGILPRKHLCLIHQSMVREYECSKDIIEKPVPFLVSQMSKQAHEVPKK